MRQAGQNSNAREDNGVLHLLRLKMFVAKTGLLCCFLLGIYT